MQSEIIFQIRVCLQYTVNYEIICVLVYEANIGTRVKPCPNSDRVEKENWIKEKYVHKTFISSSLVQVCKSCCVTCLES